MKIRRVVLWALPAVALGVLVYSIWPAQTVEAAANKVARCVGDGNYRCVVQYVTERELELIGMSRKELVALMEDLIQEQLGDQIERTVEPVKASDDGMVYTVGYWLKGEGDDVGFGFSLSMHEEGPRIISLTTDFILALYIARPEGPPPTGLEKILFLRDVWSELDEDLSGRGLHGTLRQVDGGLEFWTWAEWTASYESIVADIEAKGD